MIAELRFIERGGKRILQMKKICVYDENGEPQEIEGAKNLNDLAWEDVPLAQFVEESVS